MSNPIIKLEDINLYYNKGEPSEVWALKNINIEINKGEYCAFFGPSGCGKTTLLYTISGMESTKVASGRVMINGRDISQFTKKEQAVFRQIGIGIVFQQFNLIPSITVLDNVALPMAFLGISQTRRKEEAMKLLERLNIKHLSARYPSELSGGQQQRVGIARALANNPPIIVADEPLGNLDSENANKVLEFLKELNEKDGRTVIMVTHEAWSLRDAKKIFYVKDGAVVKVEEPKSKEDVQKSVSEVMYGKLHPDLPQNQVTAKAIATLFLRGYSSEEVKRFEYFLSQRFDDKIDARTFMRVLDRPYKDGGVGLWLGKARKVAKMAEELMEQKKNITEVYKQLEEDPEMPLYAQVESIRGWLLEEYKGKVDDEQKLRLDEAILERVRNMITHDSFHKIMRLSKKQFGVGLSMRSAQLISEKLDSILKEVKKEEVLSRG